jgi:hypothetical protein
MMRNNEIWPSMASAFEKTEGQLSLRLIAALEAGQVAGGDVRGNAVCLYPPKSRRPLLASPGKIKSCGNFALKTIETQ